MPHRIASCFCIVLLSCAFSRGQARSESSTTPYRVAVVFDVTGRPSLAVTNLGTSSITAMAITVDLSGGAGLAGQRIYYDSAMDDLNNPAIVPGHTAKFPIGYAVGSDLSKISSEVHAMLFYDGTAVGSAESVDALFTRRRRLLQRLTAMRDLLSKHLDPAGGGPDPATDLIAAKAQAHASLANDDLWVIDEVVFDGAIKTMKASNARNGDRIIAEYRQRLSQKINRLAASIPSSKQSGQPTTWLLPQELSHRRDHVRTEEPINRGAHLISAAYREAAPETTFVLRNPRLRFADIYQCSLPFLGGLPLPGTDQSSVVVTLTDCGPSRKWDLRVAIKDQDNTTRQSLPDVIFDLGYYNATGSCWTSYTDCNGNPQPGGADPGDEDLKPGGDDGLTTKFYFQLDNWSSPSSSSCSQCAPDPYGLNFSKPIDTPYPSPTYYFKDQTTSPGCVVNPN